MQNTEKLKFVLRFIRKRLLYLVEVSQLNNLRYKKHGPAMHQTTISIFGLGGCNFVSFRRAYFIKRGGLKV